MHTMLSLTIEDLDTTVSTADTEEFLSSVLSAGDAARFRRVVDDSRIRRRNAVAPYDRLRRLGTLEERNALYMSNAVPLGEGVARRALAAAGLGPVDVDVLVVASSTGFSVPTLDHHLASVLGLRREARCLFLSGLGCTGAVRALGLAGDLLAANPLARHGLVVSVELCSPWLQVQEPSPEDVLANILFGDGAGAAVIGASGGARGLEVVASRVETWPESLDARGARLTQSGFRHFASPRLPRLLRLHLRRCVEEFLGEHGLTPRDLGFHIANPSDHRVLETIASVLELPDAQTRPAWTSWEEHGNTLSAGPLYVLDALRRERLPVAGDLGLAIVLGPGLTCDLTLLRWHSDLAG